jgi:hypothetical protein
LNKTMPLGMRRSAVIEGVYRYTLERDWRPEHEEARAAVLFVMLNPSKADASREDATSRRGIGWAVRWGFNRLLFGNLYAFRATLPKDLARARDPEGPRNDFYLRTLARQADLIVCAWGDGLPHQDDHRAAEVHRLLREANPRARLVAFGFTKTGRPKHPVRLAYATPLVPMLGPLG